MRRLSIMLSAALLICGLAGYVTAARYGGERGATNITAGDTYTCTGACTYDSGGATAITLGSADVTALTVTTDGTGTAEVALPAGSIDDTEILDASIDFADIDNTTTLAANPAFAASECWFATTGLLCEGSTADTIETLLTFADPSGADVTVTVPATTGTVLLSTAATAATTFTCTGACTYDAGGANALTVGSADVTAVTVTTDGTGTAEVALPAGSIDSTELLDDTVALADIDNSATVGADPAYGADECWFGTTGLVCEGTTADTNETLLTFADPGADVTITVPATTGTLISHAMFSGDATVSSAGAVSIANGAVDPVMVAGLADTAATARVVTPLLLRIEFDAADFDASDDITITFPANHAVLIHDVWSHVGTLEGGVLTGTLYDVPNATGNALSSALDLNAATVQRTTLLDHTNGAIAASGSVYFNANANPTTVAAGRLYILYSHTD